MAFKRSAVWICGEDEQRERHIPLPFLAIGLTSVCLLQLCIQHTLGGGDEIGHGLFLPGSLCGIEQLQVVLPQDLGGGFIVCRVPVVLISSTVYFRLRMVSKNASPMAPNSKQVEKRAFSE